MKFIPDEAEKRKLNKIINEFIKKVKVKDAETVLGGSGAKNTWLSKTNDVDIFVKFNYNKYKNKDISKILYKALKSKIKKVTILHGSRDYYQFIFHGYTFEIIPMLKINKASQALNVTDLSQLHINWVKKNIRKLEDDIRRAKAFCKANKIYGAESYIGGFSGYSLEILIIYYKSFNNLLRAARNWKDKQIIDFYKSYKNVLKEMNISKIQSPLILVDPIQKERNAAAALSQKCYDDFRKLAKAYTKNPSNKFFEEKEFSIKDLKKKAKNNHLILINIKPLKGKRDVVGSKILKVYNYILDNLSKNEFKVISSGWEFNKKTILWFIIKKQTLSKYVIHNGPPLKQERFIASFKKKWSKYSIKKDKKRVYVLLKRPYSKPIDLIKDIKNHEFVRDKIAGFRILSNK